MDNVIIEELKENDIDEYSALVNEVMNEFNKEEVDDFQIWFASVEGIKTRRSWNDWREKYSTLNFAAKINGKIIGALEIADADRIQNLFVKKEYQKNGIGKKLFNFSIQYFINNGIKLNGYVVYSSDFAVNFYKKLGFIGDGKDLFLKMRYRRTEKAKLMYNIFKRRLTGLWPVRRGNKVSQAELSIN